MHQLSLLHTEKAPGPKYSKKNQLILLHIRVPIKAADLRDYQKCYLQPMTDTEISQCQQHSYN